MLFYTLSQSDARQMEFFDGASQTDLLTYPEYLLNLD